MSAKLGNTPCISPPIKMNKRKRAGREAGPYKSNICLVGTGVLDGPNILFTILCIVFYAFNVRKGFPLAFFGEECEPFFQKICGGRMHFLSRVTALKIC